MKTFSFSNWLQNAGSQGLQTFSLGQSYQRIAWCYSCINIIATTASSAPLAFYNGTIEPKNKIEDLEHPVNQLFSTPKEPEIPSLRVLLSNTFTYLGISGEIFWVFKRKGGKLVEIELKSGLKPIFARGSQSKLIGWRYTNPEGRTETFTKEQVLPILYFNPGDLYAGLSPLTAARLSIETEFNIAGWNTAFFKSGMKNPLLLQAKGTLTKDQKTDIKKEIVNYYSGIEGGHGAVLLQGHIDVTPLTMSPKDVDFVQGKKLNREEICAIYGVPPALVGIFEYANYSNVKEQRKIFWENTLLPKMEKISDLIQVNVLNREFPGIYCKWDTSQILGLRPEAADVAEAAKKYFEMGYNAAQVAIILNVPELDQEMDNGPLPNQGIAQPAAPEEEEETPAPEEEAARLPHFKDKADFIKWSKHYGQLDQVTTQDLIADTTEVVGTYLRSMAKMSDYRTPLSTTRWSNAWLDVVGKELYKAGTEGVRSAMVSIDAVKNQGTIVDIPDPYATLPLTVEDELKRKIRELIEESVAVIPVLFDQIQQIKADVDRYARNIANDLVHTFKESLKFATFNEFGILKVSWVAMDDQHAHLHGVECDVQKEFFPVVKGFHPRAKGMALRDVHNCSCTIIPSEFLLA